MKNKPEEIEEVDDEFTDDYPDDEPIIEDDLDDEDYPEDEPKNTPIPALKGFPRASNEEVIAAIKTNLCSCVECGTRFIKRKAIVRCPSCHSTEIK